MTLFRFLEAVPRSPVTIAVGEPETRCLLREKALNAGLTLASVISPHAFVSDQATIRDGCIIAPFCSIQARATLAENVAVNTAAIVGHDVFVDRDCGLSSMTNLGGATTVGARSYIGMGALIKERLTIGHSTIVGMGSVVYTDVPDEVVCVGNPARVATQHRQEGIQSEELGMSNREKYDAAFMEVFEIDHDKLNSSLEYQSITAWDSVGHMALVAALEEVFDIMLDMDDIIDFGSYETGIKTMEKYGVSI